MPVFKLNRNLSLFHKITPPKCNGALTCRHIGSSPALLMPTNLQSLIGSVNKTNRFSRRMYYQNESHLLKEVYSESGAIGDIPRWYRLGILKVIANIVFFIFVGSFISKTAVTILEENDIFKPEDDDDEDDD